MRSTITTGAVFFTAVLFLALSGCPEPSQQQQPQPVAPAAGQQAGQQPAQPAQPGQPAQPAQPTQPTKGTQAAQPAKSTVKTGATSEKVKVEFYIMSHCPFGVKVLNGIYPVIKQMGANIDMHVDYIAKDLGNGQFSSMHGDKEVQGAKLELCILEKDPAMAWDLLDCMNKNYHSIPNNWEGCAGQVKANAAAIKACYEGPEANTLLTESIKKANARNAKGSPTMFIADKKYSGGRTANDFMRSICNSFKGVKPPACANIPEPKPVNAKIIGDKRCKECKTGRIITQMKSMFPGLKYEEFDYTTPEGKKIYQEAGIKLLPAVLFDDSVKESDSYKNIQKYLEPKGKYLSLRVGAKFDPTAEICDNKQDDTGNGMVDCDDPTCKNTLGCRPEMPKKLEVFVMSQCPFGVKALNAMEEVLAAFKDDDLDFQVHFIANETAPGKFKALHGQPEVDENIRELCAIDLYGKDFKYMDYVLCRNKNIKSTDWQSCTGSNGIDTAAMEKCIAEKGISLHSEDIKIANGMGISASPTWVANNKYKFSGIDAKKIQENICKYNKDLKGCSAEIKVDPKAKKVPAGSCG